MKGLGNDFNKFTNTGENINLTFKGLKMQYNSVGEPIKALFKVKKDIEFGKMEMLTGRLF